MSDRLTKVSIDSVLYDLGSRGINSYETLADMVAEEISNLYEGCIAYCVEDEKYYQWKSTNEVIATYSRWRELEFGSKSQVGEMPEPTAELNSSIVQYIGETIKDADNVTQYIKGYFYQCVKADDESYIAVTVSSTTVGTYYTKDENGNYTAVVLDGKGNGYTEGVQYYRKTTSTYRWDEISTQSTDNKVDKIDGKGLSTNDLTDELKENYDNASDKAHSHENKTVLDTITEQNFTDWKVASEKAHSHENKEVLDKITQDNLDSWSDASTKAHEHTNKETLDKLSMSTDGNLTVEKESDVSLELLYGKSLTKEQYEQMITDGTIQDDMVYVVDEEDADAGWIINDSSTTATDKTWSAKKISNSTIPYVLMDVTKDIDLNEYVETGYYTPNKSFSTGWFTHSILNAPTNGWLPAGGFALEVKTFDNTSSSKWCTQVLYSYVGTDNNSAPMYTRTFFYDGSKVTFSPWKRIADIDDSKVSSEETWSSKKTNEEFIKIHKKNTSVTTAVYQWFVARYDSQTKQISTTLPITIADDVSNVSLNLGGNGVLLHTGSGEVEQFPTQISVIGIEDAKSLGLLRLDMKVDSGDTSINCIAIPSGTTITFS